MWTPPVLIVRIRGCGMKIIQTILLSCCGIVLSGCMSQETATKQMAHEFVAEFPHRNKVEIYDRVVRWISNNPKRDGQFDDHQDRDAGSLMYSGDTQIKPEGNGVNMKIGFTMNIDVRNERVRIRFTQLRRLYGSKKFDEVTTDDFFKSSTAVPYQRAAQARFTLLFKSLNDFIVQGTGDVANK
jgi:hypothetical protein